MGAVLVGIQADDLTGACDTGAPFAARGLDTRVLLAAGAGPLDEDPDPAVLAIDTESRGLPGPAARARAQAAAARLARARPRVLYKKLDSTLRGAVAAELLGVLEGAALGTVLLAPAFPAQRRTVVDGGLRVDGRPAAEAPAVADPAAPRTGASVLALAVDGGAVPTGALPLLTVRAGAAAVAARLDRFAATGGRVLVGDAETADDLATLAAGSEGRPVLLAGSAGLATALAERLVPSGQPPARDVGLRRPLLVVAGSVHPATRVQLERLGQRDGLAVIAPPGTAGAHDAEARRTVAARLAAAARARIERDPPGVLVLTGGETAVAVLRALGARGVRVVGEVEPGLARATLLDGPFAGLPVVTKAGGFGDADTLVRLWERGA